jgi:hypothetical protein
VSPVSWIGPSVKRNASPATAMIASATSIAAIRNRIREIFRTKPAALA